jgi:hypothetical protein
MDAAISDVTTVQTPSDHLQELSFVEIQEL